MKILPPTIFKNAVNWVLLLTTAAQTCDHFHFSLVIILTLVLSWLRLVELVERTNKCITFKCLSTKSVEKLPNILQSICHNGNCNVQ